MLFFTSLLHALEKKGKKALAGKANLNRSWKGFCLPGSSKNRSAPSGKVSWKPRDPTAHPTVLEQGKQDRQRWSKQGSDHKAVSQQGGSQPLRSGLRSGPTITRQAHTDKGEPRSSQEVSPGWGLRSQPGSSITKQGMAVTQLETRTPSAQLKQVQNRPSGLSLNRAAGSMGEGGGPRWGWSGPLTLTSALRALTLLSYLHLPSHLLSVGVLFM